MKPRYSKAIAAIIVMTMPVVVICIAAWGYFPTGPLTEVSGFGTNPGSLKMYKYVPAGLPASSPLVVALHGCTQKASGYDDETGWVELADRYKFALLFPQEQLNPINCFRWFDPAQHERGKGEALSIAQMVAKMKSDHVIDPTRVYVTGLSAGGAMTAVMLATYPELFAGGGIMAGIPYKCAVNDTEATRDCGLMGNPLAPDRRARTPRQWGDLVRAAAPRNQAAPLISVWQGSDDNIVDPADAMALMAQWTDVLGIDQTPDVQETVNGHRHEVYQDGQGKPRLETWFINGMGHATAIDPTASPPLCGRPAPYIVDADICSSHYLVKFWGLDQAGTRVSAAPAFR